MKMHKRTRLTPLARQEIWRLHGTGNWTIVALAQEFRVSRPTIYKVIDRARRQEFSPRKSTNKRYLAAKYGIKRPLNFGQHKKTIIHPDNTRDIFRNIVSMYAKGDFQSRRDEILALIREALGVFGSFYDTTLINSVTVSLDPRLS